MMKDPRAKTQDPAAFGKTLQNLLLAVLAPDNPGPFLKRLLEILSSPGAFGPGSGLAIVLARPGGKTLAAFRNIPAAERRMLLKSAITGPLKRKKGRIFSAPILHGRSRTGFILTKDPVLRVNTETCARLMETAAQIVSARLANEERDSRLAAEMDLSSSVKHLEELYLSSPDISITELSRAVLDEARRLTSSSFGFAGYIDPATRSLHVPSFTSEAWNSCRMAEKPVVFNKFQGLWGWVLNRKKPLLTNLAQSDHRRISGLPAGHIKIHKFMGVPAMSGRKLLGMIALANPEADYTRDALATAQKLARVYAIILQRKLSEDRQRAEDNRFRTIISSSKDIIYTAGVDGKVTFISQRVGDYGYRPEDIVGRYFLDFIHPDDKDFASKSFTNAVRTGRSLPIVPYRVRKKDGAYFYAEQKSGIVLSGGKPIYLTGVLRDVTDQRETETLLRQSEVLMRTIFETASDAIFIKDMNGVYVAANKACAGMFGLKPEDFAGKTDAELISAEIAAEIYKEDSSVVRSEKTLAVNREMAASTGKNYFNIIKTPLRGIDGKITGLLGIARDVTEIKRMEKVLALASASDALSRVARPIAHDFNNALAAISGYATLIDDDLPPSSPIKEEISLIIKAVKRAAELTSSLQAFARNPKIDGGEKPPER